MLKTEMLKGRSAGGVYLWRAVSEWSREMIAAAAQAAAVAGIAEGVAVTAAVGGAATRRLGEAPKRGLGGGGGILVHGLIIALWATFTF